MGSAQATVRRRGPVARGVGGRGARGGVAACRRRGPRDGRLDAGGQPLGLSVVLHNRRADYEAALWGVCERGDWKGWICLFLECVVAAAGDAAARLERLDGLRQAWREQLGRGRSSRQLVELADGLFVTPLVTFPLAEQALGTNYRVARFAVQRLVAAGILSAATGDAFRKVFVAEDIISAIEEGL